ncbi:hypothetical protein [Nocardia sp. NPDC052566]|uniref:hypothetical protein n=1 Tax=Nocardia sp. NPDC052566 TaxID=3364330 RepID=UPI0037CB21C6
MDSTGLTGSTPPRAAIPQRAGHDWRQAGLVLLVVAALIGIPATLAEVVPVRETAVEPYTLIELTAPGEDPDTIGFVGVPGWERRVTGDQTTAVLVGPDHLVLIATVVNGVTDFDEAARWRLKVLGAQGFDAEFDGGEITTQQGFHGPTCRGTEESAVCAIVGKDNLAVTLALGGEYATLPRLLPIIDSLRVAP